MVLLTKENQGSAALDKKAPLQDAPCVQASELNPHRKLVWVKAPSFRVAIDWFNTTYLAGRGVPQENKDALLQLHGRGFDLVLLSFCGWQREQQVRAEAAALGIPWQGMYFTRSKAGWGAKVSWCHYLKLGRIVDDDDEVLWESQENGMKYYAINTTKKTHTWAKRGSYNALPQAVEAILKELNQDGLPHQL